MRIRALPAALLAVASGCYNYIPVTTPAPPRGIRAQVVLTDQGTADLARWIGPSTHEIEGEVVGSAGDELTLAIRRLERRNGIEEYWKGEALTIPRSAVASVTERRLSWRRTALFTAASVAGVVLIGEAFGGIGGLFRRDGGSGSTR